MIEFLGRRDQQVKIRGFRIELGEIEVALGQHPAVREVVVAARPDPTGANRLIAYLVLQPGPPPTSTQLRSFLRKTLPEHMLPASFVILDQLPLSSNGKLDRRGLPAPDPARPSLGAAYVAPRTPLEEVLAGIWAQVLGLARIGVHDNFFELGGHSLLATQVIARVRDACQLDLPLRRLFETPTIAELAVAIVQQQAAQVDPDAIAQLLAELEHLAPDDARAALAAREQDKLGATQPESEAYG
jgi:hypothetical protein